MRSVIGRVLTSVVVFGAVWATLHGADQMLFAEEGISSKDPNLWTVPRNGFSWKKPDSPEWGWVPEDKWGSMFQGGTKPDNLVCALAKYTVPGGEWGRDNHKILILVWRYGTDQKLKFGDKEVSGGSPKGLLEAAYEQSKENFKDLKNLKVPYVAAKFKFDKKVSAASFTGINKANGQTGFHEWLAWKGNSKYCFQITIDCPSSDEKQVRQELDRTLNAIVTGKPETD